MIYILHYAALDDLKLRICFIPTTNIWSGFYSKMYSSILNDTSMSSVYTIMQPHFSIINKVKLPVSRDFHFFGTQTILQVLRSCWGWWRMTSGIDEDNGRMSSRSLKSQAVNNVNKARTLRWQGIKLLSLTPSIKFIGFNKLQNLKYL